jgi:putative ABC transport system permease protein
MAKHHTRPVIHARHLTRIYRLGDSDVIGINDIGLDIVPGELAGITCGFVLSYILVYVISRQSFGWTFLYKVDWGALAISLPLIILTALAAAYPAIKMVFRESPATLLREN